MIRLFVRFFDWLADFDPALNDYDPPLADVDDEVWEGRAAWDEHTAEGLADAAEVASVVVGVEDWLRSLDLQLSPFYPSQK